jgi:uncharacterized protein (DUF433 family)
MSIIVRDPEIMGGAPVFRGTRVPVEALFGNLADGMSLDEVLEQFPTLDRADVLIVLREASEHAARTAENKSAA